MVGLGVVAMMATLSVAKEEPVDLALLLPPKAVIEYRLETSERSDGGAWETATSRYRVEVTPIDATGFETRWHDQDAPSEPPVVFRTDEALVPTAIINRVALIKSLSELIKADAPTSEDNAAALALFEGMSVETLTALLAKDFILTAYGQGTYLIPGELTRYQQPGGSFGDSEPMLMNASFLLESVKPETGVAVVVWTNEIDPDSARQALPGLFGDLLASADKSDPAMEAKMAAALETARFIKRTDCRYDIDIETGLATRAQCEEIQDIQMDGESRRRERKLVATQRLIR